MQKHPDVLLMFSGGLDSTGAFWKLIKDGRKVHVYHMHLENKEKRTKAEAIAVSKILEYMSSIGEFQYSESSHSYPSYNGNFIWDSDISSFMAGTICAASPNLKEVAFGRTASDNSEANGMSRRIERGNKILEALCSAKKIYPVMDLTKQQIWEMLPEELRNIAWSCRRPIYKDNEIVPCGGCITCHSMAKKGITHQKILIDHNQS